MEFAPWLFAVLGGAVLLGVALVYGIVQSRKATRRQREAAERGAHELYHEKDGKRRAEGPDNKNPRSRTRDRGRNWSE